MHIRLPLPSFNKAKKANKANKADKTTPASESITSQRAGSLSRAATEDGNATENHELMSNAGSPGRKQQSSHESKLGNKQRHTIWSWTKEIGSVILGIVLLVVIAIVLGKNNTQKLPNWPSGITLNSLIAVLSTFLRASLMTIVTEAVSQFKWAWFRNTHPLKHLDAFDTASRGPLDSALLPFRIKRLNWAYLGSCLTILSLAIGPFTQQAIKSVPCEVPAKMPASIPTAKFVQSQQVFRVAAGEFELDYPMKGAIVSSLTNPGANLSAITPNCPSGNCSFVSYGGITYSSLGMCSSCTDVATRVTDLYAPLPVETLLPNGSSTLGYVPAWEWALPNGLSLPDMNSTEERIYSPTYLNVGSDFGRGDLEWLTSPPSKAILQVSLLNVSILSYTINGCTRIPQQDDDSYYGVPTSYYCPGHKDNLQYLEDTINIAAVACSLYPCLKQYNGSVVNGLLEEVVVDSTPMTFEVTYDNQQLEDASRLNYDNLVAPNPHCVLDGTLYTSTNMSQIPSSYTLRDIGLQEGNVTVPADCLYAIKGFYSWAMFEFLNLNLNGSCGYDGRQEGLAGDATKVRDNVWCDGLWWLAPFYNRGNASAATMIQTIDNLANAITNQMRTVGVEWDGLNDTAANDNLFATKSQVLGTAFQSAVCTKFDWKWLLLPALLLVATMILLVIVAFPSLVPGLSRDTTPIWKASLLPLLFHGLEPTTSDANHPDGQPMSLAELHKASNDMMVRLGRDGQRWGLYEEKTLAIGHYTGT